MKNNIPVFIASDDNYAPYAASLIASIMSNTSSFIEFYILSDGISNISKTKTIALQERFSDCSIEFIDIDMSIFSEFKIGVNMPNGNYITLATYIRFLIPELKPQIDRAIYLDPDAIVLRDIKLLWETDMENYALAAAFEPNIPIKTYQKERTALQLSSQHFYFNAGVLSIDCKKWRENNITNQLFEIDEQTRNISLYNDQSTLNKCFNTNYKRLDTKFNALTENDKINREIEYLSGLPEDYIERQTQEMVIRHFNGNFGKPWNTDKAMGVTPLKNADDFWKYMKMTMFYDEVRQKFEITNPQQIKIGLSFLRKNLGKNKRI